MSAVYLARLRAVRTEYEAVHGAVSYIRRHWQRLGVFDDPAFPKGTSVSPIHFERAAQNLEATYVIRAFAEFEGILMDHLDRLHPAVRVPDRPKADWLISKAARLQSPVVDRTLVFKVRSIQKYRNRIVHPRGPITPAPLFSDVLSDLNRYIDRLPDPP
jgi:hypothetical protein